MLEPSAQVNLQIFVMEFFVVQTYPIPVGSCFHYPLQGIMDHFHEGFHSLEMVMELIVNWERASFHKESDGGLCGSNLPGHCWQLLSLPSSRNHGSFS